MDVAKTDKPTMPIETTLPSISIAMCTYNGARHIQPQIDSILKQDYSGAMELVISDDCSTDGTWEFLIAIATTDPRVKILRNAQRLGFSDNFMHTIKRCTGDLIALSDQDDIWETKKLSILASNMGANLLIYSDSSLVGENGESLGIKMSDRARMFSGSGTIPFCFWNCISGHAMMIRKELLTQALPFPAGIFHDWWLAAVAGSMGSIGYSSMPLVHYRQHSGSQTDSAQRKKRPRNSWEIYKARALLLSQLANIPGTDQEYIKRLATLWGRRRQEWFCPRLLVHIVRGTPQIFSTKRNGTSLKFMLSAFLGQRWRRKNGSE